MATLKLTVEIEIQDMSEEALAANGYFEFYEEEGNPQAVDYPPQEIGQALMYALEAPDAQAEAFAGSDIFVSLGKVEMISAEWK